MSKYYGFERRHTDAGWKITKTFDIGTLVSLIVLLLALFTMSSKLESRITSLEVKVEMLMGGRLK